MPNLRLIPVVMFAALCLLAIKTAGFMGTGNGPASAAWNFEREIWKRVAGGSSRDHDVLITGATPEAKPPPAAPPPPMAALPKGGPGAGAEKGKEKADAAKGGSPSERALIERLQERRLSTGTLLTGSRGAAPPRAAAELGRRAVIEPGLCGPAAGDSRYSAGVASGTRSSAGSSVRPRRR